MEKLNISNLLTQKIVGPYTLRDLKEKKNISLTIPINANNINYLKYINNGTNIYLNSNKNDIVDEKKYFTDVKHFLDMLSNINKSFKITINVYNREILRLSNLLNSIPKNITLNIKYDEYIYDLTTYQKEEKKLENMIARIRYANLSPLEKFLAVYDIVKKFKKYKDNEDSPEEAWQMRYILEDNNDYIVCAGFAKLLTELLNRVNIPSKYISLYVDSSYDDSHIMEERQLTYDMHARNLIKLDDDKYNIHGYYLSDSTWDNHLNRDLYLNALLTFDRKKEAKRLEKLSDEDLLLDFHNVDEFVDKIKFFIKKRISHPKIEAPLEEELRKKAYKDIYLKIMDILLYTDRKQYELFYNKYESQININTSELSSQNLEPVLTSLLNDYARYIIPLSNNKIPLESILKALIKIKQDIYFKSNEEIKNWLMKVKDDNAKFEEAAFPYIYDANNQTEAYLQSKENNSKK